MCKSPAIISAVETSARNICHFFIALYGDLLGFTRLVNPGQDLSDVWNISTQTIDEALVKIQQVSFPLLLITPVLNGCQNPTCCYF